MLFKSFKKTIIDIEANGLLSHLIDFNTMPLKFKDIAKLYCIVLTNADNLNEHIILKLNDCTKENLKEHLKNTEEVIWHNGIKYDAPALFLFNVLDYKVYYYPDDFNNNGEIFNKPIRITDTLILSKFLQPDRIFGHSLKNWGIHLSDYKDDYRQVCIDKGYITKDSPKGSEFAEYHDEVVSYCVTDTKVTGAIYDELIKENNNFKIALQYHVELKSADLALRQELYGFKFNAKLANKSLQELNEILLDIKTRVDPRLPPKLLNKGEQKGFIPPATQFKINGDFSAHFNNFIQRIGAEVSEDKTYITFEQKRYDLPLKENVCLKNKIPSTIDDLDNLKAYLLDLGWDPIEWKIRDLTKDSKKKKVPLEKLSATVKRYVDNTLNGPYKKYRLDILGIPEDKLEEFLLSKMREFSIIVPVSPLLRIGVEKNLCPNLEILGSKADFVEDVVKYLTYKHRRNTIAGGTEDEDGDPTTGYLSLIRSDGRVSTPSDTLGASTTRTRHIEIANVPRVSSLFGEPMRAMFGVEKGRIQYGYDYSAVEARVSGHFVYPYKGGPELAESYVAAKPNDCFDKETLLLTDKGWIHSDQITEDTLIANWSTNPLHLITYAKPSNIVRRQHVGKMVRVLGDRLDIKVTPNHILVVYNRDTKAYLEIEAKDLKQYVINNPNTFIPSCGNSTLNLSDIYSYDYNDIIIENEKESGILLQTYNYDTIVKIVTRQRLSGSSSLIFEKQTDKGIIYQTTIGKAPLNTDGFKLIPSEIFNEDVYEDVWCVTVPTHYIFVKRNNSIYVTSQCHTVTQKRLGLNTRDEAKTLGYAILYGASYKKLIKMLKISDAEAKRMFDLYWEGVPALKELSTRVESFWNSTGKKYILAIDKRKLFVRSKHSLVNLLFQSTGALIMKYGNLETAKRLDELGILGDPFFDTRDAKKIFQMIIYHDEAQYDVHPDLIPIHKYKTEEEAKANLIVSNNGVSHVGDEFWIAGENILSKTLDDSIKFACDSFKMRVPIGIEFNVGTTWAECH